MIDDPRLHGEPFTFKGDTIPGRRWRVADGWLECDAMNGYSRVLAADDQVPLARAIAWLSGAGGKPPTYGLAFGPRSTDKYELKSGLRRLPRDSRPSHAHPYGPFGTDRTVWVAWADDDYAKRHPKARVKV